MSPVSSSKVSDPAAARVQVPFTLSDTCAGPGALYWANHPTSRSPSATGRVSVTVSDGTRDPVENAAPWTNVGLATAVQGRRTPSAAITARLAVDRADVKYFTAISASFFRMRCEKKGRWSLIGLDPTPSGSKRPGHGKVSKIRYFICFRASCASEEVDLRSLYPYASHIEM